MATISREECNSIAYRYFDPACTPNDLSYEEAAFRFAACLYDKKSDSGKTREKFKDALVPGHTELYILSLEKLADGDVSWYEGR